MNVRTLSVDPSKSERFTLQEVVRIGSTEATTIEVANHAFVTWEKNNDDSVLIYDGCFGHQTQNGARAFTSVTLKNYLKQIAGRQSSDFSVSYSVDLPRTFTEPTLKYNYDGNRQ